MAKMDSLQLNTEIEKRGIFTVRQLNRSVKRFITEKFPSYLGRRGNFKFGTPRIWPYLFLSKRRISTGTLRNVSQF